MEGIFFRPPKTLLGFTSPPLPSIARDVRTSNHPQTQAAPGTAAETISAPVTSRQSRMFFHSFGRIWPVGGGRAEEREVDAFTSVIEEGEREIEGAGGVADRERENWVTKILRVRSVLPADERRPRRKIAGERWEEADEILNEGDRCVGCEACLVGEEEEGEEYVKFDRESFSRLLRRVPLQEIRLFFQLSDLGSIAYVIGKLRPSDLLEERGMELIASSADQRLKLAESASAEETEKAEKREQKNSSPMRAASAYQIAASAASYLQSQTMSILPFKGKTDERASNRELNSFMATTDSVTAVVAAKEETKQAVAEDLNSAKSSPCEWFICDDKKSKTRFFVIQGSESFASWQANLLFEPVLFEGLDVLVHRGIYEAAKGIYEQMLPHVRDHLKSCGGGAAFRFTGHSLGGSLSLIISLMLLIRGEIPASSLLPVVTFGAPSIMCGGDELLQKLGLPRSHVQAITMHRDIVPRAFSCHYPDHVAEILKALNGNFRSHPCLKHQKLLYAPMGELLIMQPEEKFSPHHELLPAGTGLYALSSDSNLLLRAAKSAFFNSPHPLEILGDRAAYGAEGTVYRDHDVNAYLRSVRVIVDREVDEAEEEKQREIQLWWPLMAAQKMTMSLPDAVQRQMGMLLVMLLPVKFLAFGVLSINPLG